MTNLKQMAQVLGQFKNKDYWNKENTLEFVAFMTKLIIIIPGLIFGVQWWWLYIIAFMTSFVLVLTSTVKTLPTIIVFNFIWMAIAVTSIVKHFTGA